MNWKSSTRIFGIILSLISLILIITSIIPLFQSFIQSGVVIEYERPLANFTIGVLLLTLGLIYSYIPNKKINKTLKISEIIALIIISFNIIYYVFVYIFSFLSQANNLLSLAIVYMTIIFPVSAFTLFISIILGFLVLFKKK